MPKKVRTHKPPRCAVGRQAPESRAPSEREITIAQRLRNSGRWQKARRRQLREFPLCADPMGDHGGEPFPAAQAHHIIPLWAAPGLLTEASNLASLCALCHGRIEAAERAGINTRHRFQK
jgi:hypothetical protein